MTKPKEETGNMTLLKLFNTTFMMDVKQVTLEQVHEFHSTTTKQVTEFLRFSGLRMEAINFGDLAGEANEDVSGFTRCFEKHFGGETGDVEISLKAWFEFYATVGKILEPSFRFLCKEWDKTGESSSGMKPIDRKLKKVYDGDLYSLGFATKRTPNALVAEGIRHVGTLVSKSENELLRTPNIGRTFLNDVRNVLLANNLSLGTDVGNWKPPEEK